MGGKKSHMPQVPTYVQPQPYQQPAQPAQAIVPQVKPITGIYQDGIAADQLLVKAYPGLDLNKPSDPAEKAKAENYYRTHYGNPATAQTRANLYANGQSYGTYGGAAEAGAQQEGEYNAWLAGLDREQMDTNNIIAKRASLGAQPISQSQQQNANDVSRGLGVAGLEYQNNAAMNNYNLAANGNQNSFNMGNYGNQVAAYGQQQQQSANRAYGIGALGLGAAQLIYPNLGKIGRGIGSLVGSGGGGVNPVPNPTIGYGTGNPYEIHAGVGGFQ